jgi:hypothetical protein
MDSIFITGSAFVILESIIAAIAIYKISKHA